MKVKTFTADTMAGALALVKRDLGIEAVILHTRTYRRGGVLGFGARTVVEITATDDARLGRRRTPDRTKRAKQAQAPQGPPPTDQLAGDLIRRTYAAAQTQLAKNQTDIPVVASPVIPPVAPRPVPQQAPYSPPPTPPDEHLADELRAVKRMVKQMLKQRRREVPVATGGGSSFKPDIPDKLFDQYLHLLEQQVTEELAEEVIQQVRDNIDGSKLEDSDAIRQAVLGVIAGQILTDESAGKLHPTQDGRPRTIALVGPTGVGKTTTVAKLAATFKIKQGKHVGLITLDTYRIAAVDQLRTYANIIGIPLHVVTSPDELRGALRLCAGCDVVLIDTAGRSQRDDPRLEQLKSLVAVADPHEVHLVLSSTSAQSVLLDVVERFSAIKADRIIFTKLDEAVSFGVLLNVARMVNKRLSYITTGQEVPHQIEPSCPDRLAQLVLGDGRPC